jgi:arylformamidase
MRLFSPSHEVFDVTVPFSAHVPAWPSHPASRVEPLSRIAEGAGSNVSRIEMTSHAGTHVDANWHFVNDGARLLDIPLERWNGPCYVAHFPDEIAQIGVADLEAAGIPAGTERLILRTLNSHMWDGWAGDTPVPFCEDYAGLLPEAARWLVNQGVRLIGTDALSVGSFGPANRETHTTLLGNDVLIIELLDLRGIEAGAYELICLPLKLAIGDGAPARVLLVRES